MTQQLFEVLEQEGGLAGPVRRPVNVARDAEGSIHDDATAQKLGFRGGTVAGNIHFEQFPPLMVARFGEAWRRSGGLSLYFLNPTTDGEPVQAFVGPVSGADPRRASAWMETPEGVRVCEGGAWIGGPNPASELRQRIARQRPAAELRILAAARVGQEVTGAPSRLDGATCLRRLEAITEPLPEHRDAGVFGERVAALSVAIDALRVVEQPLFQTEGQHVGMFGAIEFESLGRPVFLDHDYLADGRILALGESPKTEIAWYESTLRDAADGAPVARLIMMTRLLKASSPAWA